jgi:hypothetical protein
MWANDMHVELLHKTPIQFMHKARFVVTVPPRISRGQYQNISTIRRQIFEVSHCDDN